MVGSSPKTLLDGWALAEAIDDLLNSPGASTALPQLATWVPPGQGGGLAISRTQDAADAFAAGRGNYVAWYLLARAADAGRGASLTFESVRSGVYRVRLTRLR